MKKGASISTGKSIQKAGKRIEASGRKSDLESSIMAVKIVKEFFKSSFGPRAMKKFIDIKKDEVTVTSDGLTIFEKMPIQHPVIRMMVETVKTHSTEVGDGAKTIIVLVGGLLERAEELLNMKLHPTVIIDGYRLASDRAIQILNEIAVPIEFKDPDILNKVAVSSMCSADIGSSIEHFAKISIDAIKNILEKKNGKDIAEVKRINFVKRKGKSFDETQFVQGLIIENYKCVLHEDMPKRIENPKIALLDFPLDPYKNRLNAEIQTSPDRIKGFIEEGNRRIKSWVEKIKASGANVLVCQRTVAEETRHYLAKEGIMGVHEVKLSEIESLAKATGGRIVHMLDNLKPEDLGTANLIEERKISGEKLIFVEGCDNPKSVSILIRAGVEGASDEAERALKHSLHAINGVVKKSKIIAGGGAAEVEIAKRIRDYARMVGGKEQLSIKCFADSLETIPKIIAENAGLNFIDVLAELRALHINKDGLWFGVNVTSKKTDNMMVNGIIEPVYVKEQVIRRAAEMASMILRDNNIIMKRRELSRDEIRQQLKER